MGSSRYSSNIRPPRLTIFCVQLWLGVCIGLKSVPRDPQRFSTPYAAHTEERNLTGYIRIASVINCTIGCHHSLWNCRNDLWPSCTVHEILCNACVMRVIPLQQTTSGRPPYLDNACRPVFHSLVRLTVVSELNISSRNAFRRLLVTPRGAIPKFMHYTGFCVMLV